MTRAIMNRWHVMALPSRLVDVTERPNHPKALPRDGAVDPANDGGARSHSESNAPAVVQSGDVDLASERHPLACIDEGRHVKIARGVPAVFNAYIDGMVVAKAIPPEATEVVVAADHR